MFRLRKKSFINVALWPLVFFCLSLLIMLIDPYGYELTRYDQEAVKHGELWRMLTSHFTHGSWNHFLLNMLGLAIMAVLFSQVATQARWLIIMIFGSIFSSICFLLFSPDDYVYVGMSDVLHGVIIAFAMLDYKHFKIGSAILIVGTLAKVTWEQTPYYVESSAEFIGGAVATDSHLYGSIAGLMIGSFFLWQEKNNKKADLS